MLCFCCCSKNLESAWAFSMSPSTSLIPLCSSRNLGRHHAKWKSWNWKTVLATLGSPRIYPMTFKLTMTIMLRRAPQWTLPFPIATGIVLLPMYLLSRTSFTALPHVISRSESSQSNSKLKSPSEGSVPLRLTPITRVQTRQDTHEKVPSRVIIYITSRLLFIISALIVRVLCVILFFSCVIQRLNCASSMHPGQASARFTWIYKILQALWALRLPNRLHLAGEIW